MSNIDDITMVDLDNLKSIKKKLKISPAKVMFVQRSKKLTPEQKAKKVFNLPEETDLNTYLEENLSESEIETINKLIKAS